MHTVEGIIVGILLYGSAILSALTALPFVGFVVLVLFRSLVREPIDSAKNAKPLFVTGLPILIFVMCCGYIDMRRTFRGGYFLSYQNSGEAAIFGPHNHLVVGPHILENEISRSGRFIDGKLGDGRHFRLDTAKETVVYSVPIQSSLGKPATPTIHPDQQTTRGN